MVAVGRKQPSDRGTRYFGRSGTGLSEYGLKEGILAMNPAREVKSQKFSRMEGKTRAPPQQEVQRLLDSIDVAHLVGLRDRAFLAVMAGCHDP
jgi:site-specific recombinase XerC